MDDVKSVWENGVAKTKEELREERKAEIQQIRSRLFMVRLCRDYLDFTNRQMRMAKISNFILLF